MQDDNDITITTRTIHTDLGPIEIQTAIVPGLNDVIKRGYTDEMAALKERIDEAGRMYRSEKAKEGANEMDITEETEFINRLLPQLRDSEYHLNDLEIAVAIDWILKLLPIAGHVEESRLVSIGAAHAHRNSIKEVLRPYLGEPTISEAVLVSRQMRLTGLQYSLSHLIDYVKQIRVMNPPREKVVDHEAGRPAAAEGMN